MSMYNYTNFVLHSRRLTKALKLAACGSVLAVATLRSEGQERTITLKEAIDLTIKNSHTLQAGRARIDAATAAVTQARQSTLPSLGASASYLRLNNANVDVKIKSNNTSGGGTTTSSSPKVTQAGYGILNASYPVFTGGRLKYGIESAKYLQQAALLDVDNEKESVIYNTINAFTALYKAITAVTIVRENLASSRHRDSSLIRMESNGLLARNDLLKARLATSDIELSLVDAENDRNLANINLDIMLGLPQSTMLNPDFASIAAAAPLKNIEDYEMMAVQNRKDLQAIGFRKRAAITNIKSARTEMFPNIALSGGYIAAYIPHVVTITNAVNLGVGVQYNLASLWKTNTTLLQARARQQEVLANEAELNDAIKIGISADYLNYLSNQKKIEVYEVALSQATENFRITKNKFDNSLVTTTELLDADVALLRARLNLSIANADVIAAYNKLLQTAGLLTDK